MTRIALIAVLLAGCATVPTATHVPLPVAELQRVVNGTTLAGRIPDAVLAAGYNGGGGYQGQSTLLAGLNVNPLTVTTNTLTLSAGLLCFNGTCTAKCQFTGGNLTCNGMTIIQGDSGQLIESLGTGAAGAYYASAGAFRTDLTTAPQFICGGASSCGFQGVTGQTTQLDCGGGTCTAQLGVTNATTTTVGRSGQTTNLNGNVAIGSNFTSNLSTSSASGNQFACSGAATCNLQSASGQTAAVDIGGGTATASIGATNATTTTVGRSGQTTNINGSAAFGTREFLADKVSSGISAGTLLATGTNYSGFKVPQAWTITDTSMNVTTASTATAANTVITYTDGTNTCTATFACNTVTNTTGAKAGVIANGAGTGCVYAANALITFSVTTQGCATAATVNSITTWGKPQ